MTKLEPGIELQKLLATQIFSALQGEVTEPIREECEGMGSDVHLHSIMQGTSLKGT